MVTPAQGYRLQNWGKIARAFESTTILRFLGPQYHLTANTESETTDALGALPSSPDGNSLRDRSRISTSVHRLTASLFPFTRNFSARKSNTRKAKRAAMMRVATLALTGTVAVSVGSYACSISSTTALLRHPGRSGRTSGGLRQETSYPMNAIILRLPHVHPNNISDAPTRINARRGSVPRRWAHDLYEPLNPSSKNSMRFS